MELIERLEAAEQIRQLVARYAVAYDARDIDTLIALHAPDAREQARERLAANIRPGRTFHLVAEPVISFESPSSASGRVVCRAELEEGAQWIVAGVTYEDRYVRVGDSWLLAERAHHIEYSGDVLSRP